MLNNNEMWNTQSHRVSVSVAVDVSSFVDKRLFVQVDQRLYISDIIHPFKKIDNISSYVYLDFCL